MGLPPPPVADPAATAVAAAWSPESWRGKPALQMPTYPDPLALDAALHELKRLPPLVTSWEILALKQQLADAQEGKRFLLQGGDCAENFSDCESTTISNRLKVLLQMSLVLVHGMRKPVIRVGRFAGQYAKPRSADTETRDGVTLPTVSAAGPVAAPDRCAQPRRRAGPAELHPPHGGCTDRREAAAAVECGQARWPACAVGVRCDAWQHREHQQRLQDASFRQRTW